MWRSWGRRHSSRAAVGAVGAAGAIRIFGSGSAIVAVAIRGVVARLRAGLRAGEAHHQGEEEHADEPRRGPEAARRAAPSRGSARGRGGADGPTAALGRRRPRDGGEGRGAARRKGLDGTVQYRAEQTEHRQQTGKQGRGHRDKGGSRRGRARVRHGIRIRLVRGLRNVDGVVCLEGIGHKQPAQIADDRERRLDVIERRVHLGARRRHVGERLGRDARLFVTRFLTRKGSRESRKCAASLRSCQRNANRTFSQIN